MDPSDRALLAEHVFSKPHADQWKAQLNHLIDVGDEKVFKALNSHVFSQPHAAGWQDEKRKIQNKIRMLQVASSSPSPASIHFGSGVNSFGGSEDKLPNLNSVSSYIEHEFGGYNPNNIFVVIDVGNVTASASPGHLNNTLNTIEIEKFIKSLKIKGIRSAVVNNEVNPEGVIKKFKLVEQQTKMNVSCFSLEQNHESDYSSEPHLKKLKTQDINSKAEKLLDYGSANETKVLLWINSSNEEHSNQHEKIVSLKTNQELSPHLDFHFITVKEL